uniref:PCI domain-containing protein n=1 Tax=Ditylenchus dipsaci TaxID=166011 RepID=A0A915DNX6_9BILA
MSDFSDNEDYGMEYADDSGSEPESNWRITSSRPRDTKGRLGIQSLETDGKLTYKLKNFDSMLTCYGQLLTYIKSRVSISMETEFLQQFYQITLDAMMESKNDRAKSFLPNGHWRGGPDERDSVARDICPRIQMYTAHKNNQAIGELYTQAINVKSAIEHPLTMGLSESVEARCTCKRRVRQSPRRLFEAFKSYDESGSVRRLACLKYMVLANMLMKSNINPFENQQTNQFRNEPEILAMTQLVHAYQNNDVNLFEQVLTDNYDALMDDPFIKEHIEELLGNIRSDVLMRLIKPYIKTKLNYLADELKIDQKEVIRLLIDVIHDKCQIQETALVNRGLEPIEAHLLQDMNKIGTTEK